MKRRFLFLQGVCSPFFARLATGLQAAGHEIYKIHFNGGDLLYWGGKKGRWYRGSRDNLGSFLAECYQSWQISDQILFGDCRPLHQIALAQGRKQGVRNHVFEEGYFRPHWLTLEREGVNGHSLLPRDPDWFRQQGERLPEVHTVAFTPSPFRVRAFHDVAYHLAGVGNPILFPAYGTHAPVTAPVEYAGYLKRFARLAWIRKQQQQSLEAFITCRARYFLLPLQLNGDAQIRHHSPFAHMGEVINLVLESFARHAPGGDKLVIKNHPLDMGLMDYEKIIHHAANRLGVAHRLLYLEEGELSRLLGHALGVITVNSTVGLAALAMGSPTLCLANPIYNLVGLTFQGKLDDFWLNRTPPDATLFRLFQKVVMHTSQVNGGLYGQQEMALAVTGSLPRLTAEHSPLEMLT
ncbi:MAG: capsular biosynthesis protein [Magnetococcales bacterium]|nr:capsular biosynthesis protein [Magnetococcales bacterium]NGZ28987.1 capsular biosynthesis protein [Magnetococcales bacterium]